MNKQILLLILISFFVGNVKAQQRLSVASISTTNTDSGKLYYATNRNHEAPRAIEFKEETVTATDFITDINSYFKISDELSFVETASNVDDLGMQHYLMQQYYKGIPLEGLAYRVHEKNGFVTSANGKAVREINLDITTNLSEEEAFDLAIQYLQTKDTVFRTGRKLIVSNNFTYTPESFSVAYQFDINVSLIERWRISIDANTGQIINKVSLVNTCLAPPPPPAYDKGTGLTNYYGDKTISIKKSANGSYRMTGQTEHEGNIETYDFRNVSILSLILFPEYATAYHFYSEDNVFNDPYEQPAVSVQWAAEQAYEYFYINHSRNSFDNEGSVIKSYVHVDEDLDNAFWTGELLAFGDGSNGNPPVELDIVSHEFTHGVTQYEADLNYSYEPGALNESFSDIFAKAVEFTTLGEGATWQLARHFRDGGLRDMSNPNLKGQPDTYYGDLWHEGYEDNGGVHTNSGVQNFWFYLLCEGGSGVNDRGINYSIQSIGMDTAVNIAYRNLTEYLIPSSDYLDSRIGSLLATADLYGKNSSAYQEVNKAWDAVGVIDKPIITSFDLFDITATTVKLNGSLLPRGDTVTYHFEYGTTTEFEDSTSIYYYNGTVEGIIRRLQSETKYYVRLVATNENGSSYATTEFTTISLAPLVKIKNTVDVTDSSATLHGEVNPNSLTTSFHFEYGPTTEMELVTPSYPLSDTTEFLKVSAPVTGLQPRQTYYYKLVATNDSTSSETDSVNFFTALKPIISSFTPMAAIPGEEITISGQHFHSSPEKNWVNFGATRGTVVSSSLTEIIVEVPEGASFGPISLQDTESGLVTESSQKFVPTYAGDFSKGGLQLHATYDDFSFWDMEVHDMDGDRRPDLVATNSEGITLFQNVNTGGDISNESFVQSRIPTTNSFSLRGIADFDGNGLKDIIGIHQSKIRIYPNFSVSGFIFFGTPVDLPFGYWQNVQASDYDNDGHIDISGTNYLPGDSSIFTIFRNQNPKGILSPEGFEQRYSTIVPYDYVQFKTIEDLDNNDYPDLILSTYGLDYYTILKNKSTQGVFEFEKIAVKDSIRGRYAKYIAQDLNQDGWKDITSHSPYGLGKLAVFENEGSNIKLTEPIVILDGHAQVSIQPGDIDGDRKVDLIVGDDDGKFIFLKNNIVSEGHVSDSSFELIEHYGINLNSNEVESEVMLNDLNGDGRPEVINNLSYSFYPFEGHQLEIWQNMPNNCVDPALISLDVARTSATIVLPPNTSLDQFDIEYIPDRYDDWYKVSSSTLSNLSVGTSYRLRIRGECDYGYTSYYYIDFITNCVDLSSFTVSDIQSNEVSITASNFSSFEIEYSEEGKEEWIKVSRYDNQISNLKHGTTYKLRYRGRCEIIKEYNYTQFTTLCPTLTSLTIDELIYNRAIINWENDYDRDVIVEYSEDDITWKSVNESGTIYPLIPGKEYFVRGKLSCTDINSEFIYTSFITPCPKASMLTVDNVTPFSANITWNDESNTGSYTVRYSTSSGNVKTITTNSTSFYLDGLTPGTDCLVSVAPECISDKDFTSINFTTVCYAPYNFTVGVISHTAAELSWESDYSGPKYTFDYSILGSNDWHSIETGSSKVSLNALRPGTKYHARVRITCLDETATYASMTFQTNLYGETVLAPNPTDHTITIYPSKNVIGNYFAIYDDDGKRVIDGKLLEYTIDLSGLSSGTFILVIDEEDPMKIIKR